MSEGKTRPLIHFVERGARFTLCKVRVRNLKQFGQGYETNPDLFKQRVTCRKCFDRVDERPLG